MSGKSEMTTEDSLPSYAELIRLLQVEESGRFVELARTFNKEEEEPEDAQKNRQSRHQYAGKILCAARITWDREKEHTGGRHQTFPDYFESITGCRPSGHGSSCAKLYREMVLTGIIAESDYDENSANAIEINGGPGGNNPANAGTPVPIGQKSFVVSGNPGDTINYQCGIHLAAMTGMIQIT